MDEIELRDDMTAKERIKVLIRQYDIRLSKDFCVNDPIDYQQTKGKISGLNDALDQIKIAAKRDMALVQEITNYLQDTWMLPESKKSWRFMAEEIMHIVECHRAIDVSEDFDEIRRQLEMFTTARNVIYANLCKIQKKLEDMGFKG